MKRLVTMAACLAMLTLTGCAGGILNGGLFNGGNSGCNSGSGTFGASGGGLLSDGPLRQFMRGDACDSCNSAAGQLSPSYSAPIATGCDTCNGGVPVGIGQGFDPYATPSISYPNAQPATSFYTPEAGVSLGQPEIGSPGVSSIDPGGIYDAAEAFGGTIDGGLSDPPTGVN